MRVHLLAPVPHRDVVNDWEPCAFTGKALRLCRMLTGQGHTVILYGGARTDAPVAEHVIVTTDEQRTRWFEDMDASEVFNDFDPTSPCWAETNTATVDAVRERWEPGDILGLTMGAAQAPVAEAFTGQVVAEMGIGYEGVLPGTHWCVESEAWRHYLYGKRRITDGRFYDTVIPNAYDPDDYEYRQTKDDYLLYLGRMTPRKGLAIVAELAKHHRVITAGPGADRVPGAEHLGVVTGDDKRKLLAAATAVLVPTQYIEPFGGVAIEAMLSGTPVITTPWGAFSETVVEGRTGWRCHTLNDFLAAAKAAQSFTGESILDLAMRYSIHTVAPMYDRWLERLATLYSAGWYT